MTYVRIPGNLNAEFCKPQNMQTEETQMNNNIIKVQWETESHIKTNNRA
jgi:hypothetical protein